MPKPVPDAPARYRAFLSALRRTANAELAFRQSGVNRSWAYWQRKRDAEFARDWSVALQTLRLRLHLPERRARWKRQQYPALPSIEEVQAEIAQIVKVMRVDNGRKGRRLAPDAR